MPTKPSLSGTLLEARAWKRLVRTQAPVKPRHALAVSLWTGLIVTTLTTLLIATRVAGGPASDMPLDVPHSYADPRDLYPDTDDVVREKLDVRPVLTPQAEGTGPFLPPTYEAPAYRPVSDKWIEPSDTYSDTYSEPNAPTGDKAVYLSSDRPSSAVMICTGVCRSAEDEARDTVEPLLTTAPVMSTDQAPVVPATMGAPVIVETPSGG